MDEQTEMAVRLRAYQIWEREGRPHDKAKEHWEQALQELGVDRKGQGQPSPVPSRRRAGGNGLSAGMPPGGGVTSSAAASEETIGGGGGSAGPLSAAPRRRKA
jgi:ferric-dicitrate binding protein FerR (iron transport regulator)